MSEPEFLSGKALADRVRLVCREDAVDCAVAFLGQGVRDDLFPDWQRQKVRIVCDLAMGCTSRAALEEFGAPENDDLVYHDGLHAKVYLSRAGAVIGSPNLSRNGLGLTMHDPGNLEAGVFHPSGSTVWTAAKAWLESLFAVASMVDATQFARVPLFARDPGSRVDKGGVGAPSVLDRVRSDPDRFANVVFLSTAIEIDEPEVRQADAAYARDEGKLFERAGRTLLWLEDGKPVPEGSAAILYWHHGKRPLRAYTDIVSVRVGDATALYGVDDWRGFWRRHGMSTPKVGEAVRLDRDRARSLDGSEWAFAAHELAARLVDLARG